MNIYLEVLLFLVLVTDFTRCCSQDEGETMVENAHVSCQSNDTCTAECYRGYILSNGERKTIFKCQNKSWPSTPMVCKRIPVVAIEYYTIWVLDVQMQCNNISQRLQNSKQRLEDQFIDICKYLNIDMNVTFTFSPTVPELKTTFYTEYENASSINIIDLCIAYTKISFWNVPIFRNMIDNITCNGSIITYNPNVKLNITEKKEICHQNTTVENVTVNDMDNIRREVFCENLTTTDPSIYKNNTEANTFFLTSSVATVANEPPSNSSNVCLEIPQILFLTVPAAVILILVTATITALVSKKSNSKKIIHINPDDVILRQIQPTDVEMEDITEMENTRGEMVENDLFQRTSGVQNGGTYSAVNDVSTSDTYSLVVKDYNVVRNSAAVRNSTVVKDYNVVRDSTVVRDTTENNKGHLSFSVENVDMESMPEDYLYSQVQKNKRE